MRCATKYLEVKNCGNFKTMQHTALPNLETLIMSKTDIVANDLKIIGKKLT